MNELGWVGTKRFWTIFFGALVIALGVLLDRGRRLAKDDAKIPVVVLSGPNQVTPGEPASFGVLVRDRFGAPMAGTKVHVGFYKTGFIELASGETGDGGEAALMVNLPADLAEPRTLVAIADGLAAGYDDMTIRPRAPGQGAAFVSTDKPIYQPGQVVHIRALAMAGEVPLANKKSVVEIRTDNGVKVFRDEKPTSAFGVVSHDFALADQIRLGTYTINVTVETGNKENPVVYTTRTVTVNRYTLPKLKIALEELSTLDTSGPLKGIAHATWIFGEPVTSGAVTVSLAHYGAFVQAVHGQVDKQGRFAFEIFPDKRNAGGTYELRAKLDVEGGLHAETSQAVTTMGSGTITLEAFPESGALAVGIPQDVFVVATHPGKSAVTVRSPDGNGATTSERGVATLHVTPVLGRVVKLEAASEDGEKGSLEISGVLDQLVVRPEHLVYDAGQEVHATVLGADPGDHVSLRLTKGSEPLSTGACQVTTSAATGCTASLAIPKGTHGLVWIHAVSLPGERREPKQAHRLVLVRGATRDLDLAVKADKPSYAPRDVGTIDVAVSAGGAPTKAELGVTVADEAVFALADVRPDLEKRFFTVDKDLRETRRSYDYAGGGRWSSGYSPYTVPERSPPAGFETTAVYDASAADDVRAVTLAALQTMPAAGAIENASSSSLESRAIEMRTRAQDRLTAWSILLFALYAVAAFAVFGLYGLTRLRNPILLSSDDEGVRRETRGLFFDYAVALLAPVVVLFAATVISGVVFSRTSRFDTARAYWVAVALLGALLLLRGVRRLRAVPATEKDQVLRRVLFLLPVGSFCGHVATIGALGETMYKLREILMLREDAAFIPILVVAFAQLAFGFVSVIRNTADKEIPRRRRIWLLLSRASFMGLPITIGCLFLFIYVHVVQARKVGWQAWTEIATEDRQVEMVADAAYDNKEGGTGTRAKGEEGSMGNPAPAAQAPTSRRYGVQGPKDNEEAKKQAAPVVRDYFPETLLWAPDVVTDDAGHAQIKVPFADSITTWRFGLRAVSAKGQLGSMTLPLVVKKDFFVDAQLPPTLTQGDEIAVPVNVFGYGDEARDVTIDVEGDGISTLGAPTTTVRLGPHESRGLRFVVRADKAGERVVRIKTKSDIVERKVLVVPNGLSIVTPRNGRAQGAAAATVEFPESAIEGGDDLSIKIYGGPLSQVGEGLDGVFQMPHGCFEQTSSVTYPSVLALQLLARTKATSPEIEKKARAYIADGYQRIVSFEVPGGGFSMFGQPPAMPALSAYGLLELADMQRVASVDEGLVERTRTFLYGLRTPNGGFRKNPHDPKDTVDDVLVTAYVVWALASFGTETPNVDARLGSVLDVVAKQDGPRAHDPYALALRVNALLTGGRKEQAKPLLDELAKAAVHDDYGVHWSSHANGVMYSYGESLDVETTGLAAHALARADRDAELRAGALDWLVAKRGGYGTWSTTQATVAAMRALLDEARPASKEPQDVTVAVDGEQVGAFRMEPNARDVHRLFGLRKFATTGKHTVEVKASGSGDVSYQLVPVYWTPFSRPPPSKLSLDVHYDASSVAVGATTIAHVRVGWSGAEPASMPLVEVGIPPGFEVETSELDGPAHPQDLSRWALERGKLTLYFSALASGTVDVPVRLRAVHAGRVVAPGSIAYLYYEPEVKTSAPAVLIRAF